MAGLRLLAFMARYVLVFAGAVLLLDRAEGGIDVRVRVDKRVFLFLLRPSIDMSS